MANINIHISWACCSALFSSMYSIVYHIILFIWCEQQESRITNETALCLQKLAATSNQSVILPQHIQPYLFTNLAFDNIDHLEETLIGGGTSHCANGIAVQPRVFGPHPPKKPLPVIPKTKQHSASVEDKPLPGYISGERVGPGNLGIIMAPTGLHSKVTQEAQKKNLIWMRTHLLNTSNQTKLDRLRY